MGVVCAGRTDGMYTDVKQGSDICREFSPDNPLFTTNVRGNYACVLCQVARYWHQQNMKPGMPVELSGKTN
jgi:hypothetical protein